MKREHEKDDILVARHPAKMNAKENGIPVEGSIHGTFHFSLCQVPSNDLTTVSGVWVDTAVTFDDHISKPSSSCLYKLRRIINNYSISAHWI